MDPPRVTAASGKQAVEMSKSSAVGRPFCQGNRNHGLSMKNPDTETIFGARTDRLQRETVDGLHEQIKYFFKSILLKKWYRWGAGNIASRDHT